MPQPAPTPQEAERAALNRAAEILADQLGETRLDARHDIKRLVQQYGLAFVNDHYVRALETDKGGGLARRDGQRRTLGGVSFHLVKETLGLQAFRAAVPAPCRIAKERRAAARQRVAKAAAKAAGQVPSAENRADVGLNRSA